MKNPALFIVFVFLSAIAFSDEMTVNEDEMFSDTETVVQTVPPKEGKTDGTAEKENSVGISGELISLNLLTLSRDYVKGRGNDGNDSESIGIGNVLFDARYKRFYKFFLNVELYNSFKENDFQSNLKECFLDTPIENAVYLRWGKQVLQWGRCYLWNPTDLINVDKATYIKRIGYKDGVYGLRIHVPRGTDYNFYGFVDTGKKLKSEEMGGALKAEFLTGATEMAFSWWNKKGYLPVWGYDFSTRILKIDVSGEIALSDGFIRDSMMEENGVLYRDRIKEEWICRASLNMGKSFDWNDQNEKINLSAELFYNEAGYDENIFKDQTEYRFRESINVDGTEGILLSGDKKTFLILNDLYEMNYCARYYAAVFTTINKFFTSDYTLTLNWIENLVDYSGIFTLGINYQNINDWYADLNTYTFIGSKNSEYTFMNEGVSVQLSIGYKF